ncbi:MAG: NosD domain-containing protein [Halobacteriales archaeon]|nr:NosD domain-containing protein [Halobacteriales archaeon]
MSIEEWLRTSVVLLAVVLLVGILATGGAAGQETVSECQTLNTQGETYELNQNITNSTVGTCISITADDVVLDGNGFTVDGTNKTAGSFGIVADEVDNVTIKNFGNVTRWQDGILVGDSSNLTLTDSTVNNNGRNGVLLTGSSNSELTDNTVSVNDGSGITVDSSSENELIGNTANSNGEDPGNVIGTYGIWVRDESNSNELIDNIARDNGDEIDSAGIYLGGLQSVNNNTLVDNTATGDQRYGIYLSEANDNELRENTANLNNEAGIYLTQNSIGNELTDNVANDNGEGFEGGPGIYGIWLDDNSNSNNLTGNEAFDNGPRVIFMESPENGEPLSLSESDEVETNQFAGPDSAGIYLGGFDETAPVLDNTLIDNEVRDTGSSEGGNQAYGIWLSQAEDNRLIDNTASENLLYGIWLSQGSSFNELIGNLAEDNGEAIGPISVSEEHGEYVEGSSGIYLGGDIVGPEPVSENTLIDNTARGSEYGIWIRNSFGNDVSESLAEDNHEGIAVEIQEVRRFEETVSPADEVEEITLAGNTFTDDTSRNNDWDFVSKVPLDSILSATDTETDPIPDVSVFPVTNLNIGASTKPDTTLSFFSPNVRLRSVRSTESDPAGLSNIGRYFEAERIETENGGGEIIVEQEELVPLLFAVVSYEDADLTGVDESTLELRRFNETAGEWQVLESPLLDRTDNLVAGATVDTSNFGVFGEGGCINRRNLGRGQEASECPFDRDVQRGGSREEIDRSTGRGGEGEHRDSATERRNRGRGDTRSR